MEKVHEEVEVCDGGGKGGLVMEEIKRFLRKVEKKVF